MIPALSSFRPEWLDSAEAGEAGGYVHQAGQEHG